MRQVTSVQDYFDTLSERFNADAAQGIRAVYQFELSGEEGGTYHVVVAEGDFAVHVGSHDAPSVTITMSASHYVEMANGKLNGRLAFATRKMKVSGDIPLAMKMEKIIPPSK